MAMKIKSRKSKRGPTIRDPGLRQISVGCGVIVWCAPVGGQSLEKLIATEQIVTEGRWVSCYI